MVKDHGKANDELKALAKEENVELPAAKNRAKWKSDKDYMGQMVKDHERIWQPLKNKRKRAAILI